MIEEPFVLEGYLYTFADIVKTENRADDTRAETETVTIETAKNDLSLILEQLAPTIDYDDGQYQGTLTLDHTTIRTERPDTQRKAIRLQPPRRSDRWIGTICPMSQPQQ